MLQARNDKTCNLTRGGYRADLEWGRFDFTVSFSAQQASEAYYQIRRRKQGPGFNSGSAQLPKARYSAPKQRKTSIQGRLRTPPALFRSNQPVPIHMILADIPLCSRETSSQGKNVSQRLCAAVRCYVDPCLSDGLLRRRSGKSCLLKADLVGCLSPQS